MSGMRDWVAANGLDELSSETREGGLFGGWRPTGKVVAAGEGRHRGHPVRVVSWEAMGYDGDVSEGGTCLVGLSSEHPELRVVPRVVRRDIALGKATGDREFDRAYVVRSGAEHGERALSIDALVNASVDVAAALEPTSPAV